MATFIYLTETIACLVEKRRTLYKRAYQFNLGEFFFPWSKVIKERRESKMAETDAEQKKDLLQILLDMKENGTIDLKDNDILSHVRMFMLAGHETTSMAMTWILLLLAQHEDCQEKVREEVRKVLGDRDEISFQDVKDMTYLEDCIKETMRLYPPVIYINAESIAEMKIGPYRIPKGTYIGLDVACVQRNERFWSDADLFNPDRHCAKTGVFNDFLFRLETVLCTFSGGAKGVYGGGGN